MLVYCDDTGWNSWKIISWMTSLTFLLSADPVITDLLQREPLNFSPNGSGVGKGGMLENKSGNISETRKDRGKVTMDGLKKLTNTLSNGTIADPLPPIPLDWGFAT